MPIYQFMCERGHATDEVFPMSGRPPMVPCPRCDSIAHYRIAPATRASAPRSEFNTDPPPLAMHDYRCVNGHTFDDLNDFRSGQTPQQGRICPECKAAAVWVPSVQIDEFALRAFPYFDRGMGIWLESKTQRDREIARRGWVESPGIDDGMRESKEYLRRRAEMADAHAATEARQKADGTYDAFVGREAALRDIHANEEPLTIAVQR